MKKFLPLLVLVLLVVSGVAFGLSQSDLLQGRYTGITPGTTQTRDADDSDSSSNDERLSGSSDTEEDSSKEIEIREGSSTDSDTTYSPGDAMKLADSGSFRDIADNIANGATSAEELGASSYCYTQLGAYSGDDENVTAALAAAYEACQYMEAAEEAMEGAEEALLAAETAATVADKDSAYSAYETAQDYADSADDYADSARNAADNSEDAADEVSDGGITNDIEKPDIITDITDTATKEIEEEHLEIELQQFEWYGDITVWEPPVNKIEDYATEAENFYGDMLTGSDLTAFNEGGDYYEFLVSVYADSFSTDASMAESAITNAYENNMLGTSQFESYSTQNSNLNNSLNNFQFKF